MTPIEHHVDPKLEPVYPADLYDAVHGQRSEDLEFYQAVARGTESVLELGCGHGRVTEVLVKEASQVVALDLSAAAVDAAKQRVPAAHVGVGDMRAFELNTRFDRIVCPYNGVYCLLTKDDVDRMLRCVYRHLEPGGLFVFDGYGADTFHRSAGDEPLDGAEPEDAPAFVNEVAARGERWRVYESSSWNHDAQTIAAHYRHVAESGSEVLASIPQRYWLRDEVDAFLDAAGLRPLVVHGDFDQSVWEPEAPYLIVTAERPRAEA